MRTAENPFEAPQETSIAHAKIVEIDENIRWYVVEKYKFLWLFIGTLGAYAVYWNYRQWKAIKLAGNPHLWAIPRALFCIFYIHSLMHHVTLAQEARAIDLGKHNASKATKVLIGILVSETLSRLTSAHVGFPIVDLISILAVIVLGHLYWKLQKSINVAAGEVKGASNARMTPGNILWIVLGGILWFAILVELLMWVFRQLNF